MRRYPACRHTIDDPWDWSPHRVRVYGDLAHTVPTPGKNSPMQKRGLGESISYERDDFRALVDVGLPGAEIYRLQPAFPPWDVVVLTHNDQDHVGDAPAFFGSTRGIATEVWMPYEWRLLYDAAGELVTRIRKKGAGAADPAGIAEARTRIAAVIQDIRDATKSSPGGSDDNAPPAWFDPGPGPDMPEQDREEHGLGETALGAVALIEDLMMPPGREDPSTDEDPAMIGDPTVVEPPDDDSTAPDSLRRRVLRHAISTLLDGPTVAQIRDQVDKAWDLDPAGAVAGSVTAEPGKGPARARQTVPTVDAVVAAKAHMRWFSVDHAELFPTLAGTGRPWQASGRPGVLTIVNAWPLVPSAVRGAPIPATLEDAIIATAALAYLSMQNQRALVALGHGQPGHPQRDHVLFSSDSGFAFNKTKKVEVPWDRIGAVVGLHHGSHQPDHNHVYEQLSDDATVVMARSGSMDTTTTNARFALLPAVRRGCTWCHADGSRMACVDRPRDVVLEADRRSPWTVVEGACTDCPRFRGGAVPPGARR